MTSRHHSPPVSTYSSKATFPSRSKTFGSPTSTSQAAAFPTLTSTASSSPHNQSHHPLHLTSTLPSSLGAGEDDDRINRPTARRVREITQGGGSPTFDDGLEAKLVILGSQDVGKTSICHRYTSKKFVGGTQATVGGSLFTRKVNVEGVKVRLQIWDTAGQERYRSMAPMYYRGAQAAILVYDITKKESFIDLQSWLVELRNTVPPDTIIQVVGSKSDLEDQRQVDIRLARRTVRSWLHPPPPSPPPTAASRSRYQPTSPATTSSTAPTSTPSRFSLTSAQLRDSLPSFSRQPSTVTSPATRPTLSERPRSGDWSNGLISTVSSSASSVHNASAARRKSEEWARPGSYLFRAATTAGMVGGGGGGGGGDSGETTTAAANGSPFSGRGVMFEEALAIKAAADEKERAEQAAGAGGSRFARARAASEGTGTWVGMADQVAGGEGGGGSIGGSVGGGGGEKGEKGAQWQRKGEGEAEDDDGEEGVDGIRIWECSALKNEGIDSLFLHINYQLVLRRHRLEAERRRKERESVHLSDASRDEDGEGRSQEKRKGKQGPCCSV